MKSASSTTATHEAHDHDLGLRHDLRVLARQSQERRRMLGLLTGVGGSLWLPGCGGGGGDSGTSVAASSSSTTTTGTTTSTVNTTTSASATTCIADPTETAGPYPADGSNRANGSVVNVLVASGIVRSNIRSSFGTSTTTAAGVPLELTVSLVNTNAACAALSGYAIYLWHCNAAGQYSLYDLPAENYLRGVQVSDDLGQATFLSIFPGCYSGRYPHIHFEVYRSGSTATQGSNALLTSQMALPREACTAVYAADSTTYSGSTANLSRVTTANDNVFGDNTAAQIAAQTPTLAGGRTTGYTGTIVIGLAL
ncbi:intradiol ring-cleavage dioxygenase [Xylophilus sp. GOD-11R]|uniref:intradiol ring-cleavage dioxygenase n=1 Tax=Xylophilus sp. GOD-11R TaxID=3089814 RepID=UPI00298D252B|nr:intradiol ring-cleavage dioxygenase [Xylophilus sp. GOD-11R]WPB57536.1 intradiol ring-cleavage dioxygenase [Xylophilus sp. GOD-11R]